MELKHTRTVIIIELILLLIVPYGIETEILRGQKVDVYTFNCTLWN